MRSFHILHPGLFYALVLSLKLASKMGNWYPLTTRARVISWLSVEVRNTLLQDNFKYTTLDYDIKYLDIFWIEYHKNIRE